MHLCICACEWMAEEPRRAYQMHWSWSSRWLWAKYEYQGQTPVLQRMQELLILKSSPKPWPLSSYMFPNFPGLIICCGTPKMSFLFGVADYMVSKDTSLHFHSLIFLSTICVSDIHPWNLAFSLNLGFASAYIPVLISLGEMGKKSLFFDWQGYGIRENHSFP